MRILWVVKTQMDVAVDRSTYLSMASELQTLGHSVRLLSGRRRSGSRVAADEAVEYVNVPGIPGVFHVGYLFDVYARVLRMLRTHPPEVMLFDPVSAPAVCRAIRHQHGTHPPLIMDVRSLPVPVSSPGTWARNWLFSQGLHSGARVSDALSVITPALREALDADYGVRFDRVVTWSSGVDVRLFDPRRIPAQAVAAKRRELGLQDRVVVLYHGTMDLRRGLGTLLEAFACLPGDVRAQIGLVLLGDGPAQAALARVIAEKGLHDAVRCLAAVGHDDVPLFIAAADAGVLPFPDLPIWRTSSPIKLFEYLAMGKPVIATVIEAHRSVLNGRGCAIFAGDGSRAHLATALGELPALSSAQREAMGREGRSLVESSYTWAAQARRLSNFLTELRGRGC